MFFSLQTPTLVGLPATYTDLSDGTTAELVLGTFTLDDSDDLAIASCDIDPTYTVTDNFDVRAAAATTKPQGKIYTRVVLTLKFQDE